MREFPAAISCAASEAVEVENDRLGLRPARGDHCITVSLLCLTHDLTREQEVLRVEHSISLHQQQVAWAGLRPESVNLCPKSFL
mmetsp:Transcript_16892/g.40394  ORF Transcript_16892/g.40394 Transcript_16892/m.40394 type:complete len:84 (+) Transcript_16892:5373-5624(+)